MDRPPPRTTQACDALLRARMQGLAWPLLLVLGIFCVCVLLVRGPRSLAGLLGAFLALTSGSAAALTITQDGATITPQQLGTATLTNTELVIQAHNVTVQGFTFDNTQVTVRGNQNHITRSRFINGRQGSLPGEAGIYLEHGATATRISYNEWTNWCAYAIRTAVTTSVRQTHIHHNWLHDSVNCASSAEAILFISPRPEALIETNTLIEYNLIDRVETDNNGEFLGNKGSGITLRGNTFSNADRGLNVRFGERNTYVNNTVINLKRFSLRGDHHRIIGNRIINTPLVVPTGNLTMEGFLSAQESSQPAGRYQILAGNILEGQTTIVVGERDHGEVPALNTYLCGNRNATVRLDVEVGTTVLHDCPGELASGGEPLAITQAMVGPGGSGGPEGGVLPPSLPLLTPEAWQRLAEDEARKILDSQPPPETPTWTIPLPEQAPPSGPCDCTAIF